MSPDEFRDLTGRPLTDFAQDCHAAALSLARELGRGRVARGTCQGVGAQHSWFVDGDDCYDEHATLLDPVLWSYQNVEPYVWKGTQEDSPFHVPHGHGSIWQFGQPPLPLKPVIELAVDPGEDARHFLEFAAPRGLDLAGWSVLLHSPVEGWPAAEIVATAYDTPRLKSIIPIDIVGMLTDINPGGLYR